MDVFFITAALMVGTAGLPHVIVRFFTVKKVSDARKSAGWALLFIAILYTTAPAIAVFARTNLIETVSNKNYEEHILADINNDIHIHTRSVAIIHHIINCLSLII